MTANLQCSLIKCIQGVLEWHMPRVEATTFMTGSPEDRADMAVAWKHDGEACFHDICWKALVDSVKLDNPFRLSEREKVMVREARRTAEFVDSDERIRAEAARIAHILNTADYAIAFTGAGISTAAGISDFRGKNGKWTERERSKFTGVVPRPVVDGFTYEAVRPTYTHDALCKLVEMGRLKHIISQNTDGLHRLSGVPPDRESDMHGNCFLEKCEKCGTRYERSYAVHRQAHVGMNAASAAATTAAAATAAPGKICVHCHKDHRTGEKCEMKGCDGFLMNTIINFGDSLESHVLRSAEEHAKASDAVFCLGSSMRVKPACDLIEMGRKPLRIIICNRQPTRFDKLCHRPAAGGEGTIGSRVFADCDRLMAEVMQHMLNPEALQSWQADRETRMRRYDLLRDSSQSSKPT